MKKKTKKDAIDGSDKEDQLPPSKKARIDEAEYKSLLAILKEEMKKKKPKSQIIKDTLDATREERRRWIEKDLPTADEVILLYPSLRVEKWV